MTRKKKFSEPTVTIGFRVPRSKAEKMKRVIQQYIDKYAVKEKQAKEKIRKS